MVNKGKKKCIGFSNFTLNRKKKNNETITIVNTQTEDKPPILPINAVDTVYIAEKLKIGKQNPNYIIFPGKFSYSEIPAEYDNFTPYQNLKTIDNRKITGEIWEKKLLVLIHKTYLTYWASWYHDWTKLRLSTYSNAWKERFLNLEPNLETWDDIFIRGIEPKTFYFVITVLEVYNVILDPNLWKGTNHAVVLLLYYIYMKGLYFVYVEDEQKYYHYTGCCWEGLDPEKVNNDIVAFFTSIWVSNGANANLTQVDASTLVKVRDHIKLKTWPFVSGYNYRNGFLYLKDGKYTLSKHQASFWQRMLIDINVPNTIVPALTPVVARWMCDLTGEILLHFNILKLAFFYSMCPLNQNLILYLFGNPWAGKSILTALIQVLIKNYAKAADINWLNPFQLHDLLNDTSVLLFNDTAPSTMNRSTQALLKRLTAGDTVMAEKKFEKAYTAKPSKLFTIMTGNEHINKILTQVDEGISDRLLGFEVPGVITSAVTSGLQHELEKNLATISIRSLCVSNSLISVTSRARDLNSLTRSDSSNPIIQWTLQCCLYVPNLITKGSNFHVYYNEWLQQSYQTDWKFIREHSCSTSSQFYTQMFYALEKLTPMGVEKLERSNKGMKLKNIALQDFHKPLEGFWFNLSASNEIRQTLSNNPWRCDTISFPQANGTVIEGPPLDPNINKQTYNVLNTIRHKTCKGLLEGVEPKLPAGKAHIDNINYNSLPSVFDLCEKDFAQTEEIQFQKQLEIIDNPQSHNLLSDEIFSNITDLTKALLGQERTVFFVGPKGTQDSFQRLTKTIQPITKITKNNQLFHMSLLPQVTSKEIESIETIRQIEDQNKNQNKILIKGTFDTWKPIFSKSLSQSINTLSNFKNKKQTDQTTYDTNLIHQHISTIRPDYDDFSYKDLSYYFDHSKFLQDDNFQPSPLTDETETFTQYTIPSGETDEDENPIYKGVSEKEHFDYYNNQKSINSKDNKFSVPTTSQDVNFQPSFLTNETERFSQYTIPTDETDETERFFQYTIPSGETDEDENPIYKGVSKKEHFDYYNNQRNQKSTDKTEHDIHNKDKEKPKIWNTKKTKKSNNSSIDAIEDISKPKKDEDVLQKT